MVLLGWAVGPGSTLPDDWFQRGRDTGLGWTLFFTDPRTVTAILAAAVGGAVPAAVGAGIGVLMTPCMRPGGSPGGASCSSARHKDVALALPQAPHFDGGGTGR